MLKHFRVARAAVLVAVVVGVGACNWTVAAEPPPAARDTPQGELHNAVAKVIYPNRTDPNGPGSNWA